MLPRHVPFYAALLITSCSSATHSDTMNLRSQVNSSEARQVEEVEIGALVSSDGEGLNLLGEASINDFKLQINCVYGSGNTAVARTFTKSQFTSNPKTAKLPKGARNCATYPLELSVGASSGETRLWKFDPPNNTTAASFNNNAVVTYSYAKPATPAANQALTNATAKVKRSQEFPATISGTASENTVAFSFVVAATNETNSSNYTVQAQTVDSNANVSGETPPLFNVSIASGDLTFNGTNSCTAAITALCTKPTATAGKLTACNGIALAANGNGVAAANNKMNTSVNGTLVANPATAITLSSSAQGTTIKFNHTIANCEPAGNTGVFSTTLNVKFVDTVSQSELTAPIQLTVNFNPN